MKRVLVTGATGFAGKHLVDALRHKYHVIGTGHYETPLHKSARVTYEQLDIRSSKSILRLLNQHSPDLIVHLAAHTTGWFDEPQAVYETNLVGTVNLYEAVAKLRDSTGYSPKLLYVGSSEAYGTSSGAGPITEGMPFLPTNSYGASKASADIASYAYTKSKKLNIVIARPFTHTGPGQRKGFFVPDMLSQVVAAEKDGGHELEVGNTDATRDYLDVRDVVRAYMLLLEAETNPGDAYNVCSGKGIRIKDLLDLIVSQSTSPLSIVQDQARMRPSDVPVFIGDNSKLCSLTGWQPHFDIAQTISETTSYWRSQVAEGK